MLITPFLPWVDLPTDDPRNMQPFDDNALNFENAKSYAINSVYDKAGFAWTKRKICNAAIGSLSLLSKETKVFAI